MSEMGFESQTSNDTLKWDQTRITFFTNLLLDKQRQGKKMTMDGNLKHDLAWLMNLRKGFI